MLVLLVLLAAADAPYRSPAAANVGEVPQSLKDARRLADELRYEEAIVEYQRYLADPDRPVSERARALLELGFLHLVLEDAVNAERRTVEALELVPDIRLPAASPLKQVEFVEAVRQKLLARTRLEVLPRTGVDPPRQVAARLQDPSGRVGRVLIRHAFSPKGPFYSSPMRCQGERCVGIIPPPSEDASFTAWYYVEALDASGETLAQVAGPTEPLQLAVVGEAAWYHNPWIWAGAGAALVAAAGVVYLVSPAPSR